MPSIDISFLNQLHDNFTNYPLFIETGTYNGETTFAMEKLFNHVYTIELSDKYYENTRRKYTGNKITFIKGDSAEKLKELCPTLEKDSIFFLDGHFAGGDTAQGSKDCPLIEEIKHIIQSFKNKGIIIIDDCRLFAKGPKQGYDQDWTDITIDSILSIISTRMTDNYYLDSSCGKNDRMIIHIREI